MGIVFLLTLAFCIFEFIGARLSNSLALLADAGHMLTDLAALGLAFFASRMATKRATHKMSYGFYRVEILSALINGAALLMLAVFIVKEAFGRLETVPEIRTQLMLTVAFVGLVINLLNGFLLYRFAERDMNIRSALYHIISDTLSSVGTILAGLVIAKTGWRYADPLASCVIAVLIVASAWRLLKDVVNVLLEAAPSHIDVRILEQKMLSIEGVLAIHDLHVWSITSGKESLSAHLEVGEGTDRDGVLNQMNEMLSREFDVHHTTLQVEAPHRRTDEGRHFH